MFENLSKKSLSHSLALLIVLFITVLANSRFEGFKTVIIDGDGKGFYAYLPSVFIYGTLDFTEVRDYEKETEGVNFGGHNFIEQENGILANKFYAGVALLIMPFFLAAYLLSAVLGFELSGYSVFFQYAVFFAALFYAALGLYWTYLLIRTFRISRKIAQSVVLLILFGTNLFLYTFFEPAFSHVYSFSTISGFLLMVRRTILNYRPAILVIAAMFLGFAILIRPTNLLAILLIPLLTKDPAMLRLRFSQIFGTPKVLFAFLLTVTGIFSIQSLIFFIQSGKLFIWTYPGEGFNFSDPRFWDVLFSYRKGLFVYSPLILLSLFGLIPVDRKNLMAGIWGLLFFILITWIFSSWWNWYYGDSFGQRIFIDYYAFFALSLSFLLSSISHRILKSITYFVILLAVILNLFQSYQYEHGIIHPDSMNKEKYWYAFLKTGRNYENVLSGNSETIYGEISDHPVGEYFNDFETDTLSAWYMLKLKNIGDTAWSGDQVCYFDTAVEYNSALKIKADSNLLEAGKLMINLSLQRYDKEISAPVSALMIIEFNRKTTGETYFYRKARLREMPPDTIMTWEKWEYNAVLPPFESAGDDVKVYIWNPKAASFYIDDMRIRFFSVIPAG